MTTNKQAIKDAGTTVFVTNLLHMNGSRKTSRLLVEILLVLPQWDTVQDQVSPRLAMLPSLI